ncbi:MAG TPA: response regulator [Desulfosporosinus sp.]
MLIKILLVEDQYHNIRLIEQILEDISENIEIIKAETGQKAITIAENEQFDLVLMDIALPDMNGIEITKLLKAYPKFKDTPFIAVTAYAMLQYEESFKLVFDDYVSKPIDDDLFTEKVKKWLGDKLL